MIMASNFGKSLSGKGALKNRLGPIFCEKDALAPQTGSVRIRFPSISINRLEWPIHVIRKPLSGALL